MWHAITKQNEYICENWTENKNNIKALSFTIDNSITITLPKNMEEYIQATTASSDLGGNIEIESRYIGFKLGNNYIKVRIHEKTKNISIELS